MVALKIQRINLLEMGLDWELSKILEEKKGGGASP